MHLEPAEDAGIPKISTQQCNSIEVSSASLPNGKRISLIKTLMTSVCERNCYYCPFRSERDIRRASFQPDELAKLFSEIHHSKLADGLFLSSGVVGGGIRSQDQILATADILRNKMNYRGYLHLKIMPGVQKAQVKQAMMLADRLSVNLEAPNTTYLRQLAPTKQFLNELLQPLQWIEDIRNKQSPHKSWKGRWPSSATQFVVGGVEESDLELLATTANLFQQMGIKRVFYSAFTPIIDTPLENRSPTPIIRQHRLYQASYLLRDYGYTLEEMPFDGKGELPLDMDPKFAWAQRNIIQKPIEINHAPKKMLLRIPGIGPLGAKRIMQTRKKHQLRDLSTLNKMGIHAKKAAPFILMNGQRPPVQLQLI
ncbi:MAG: putative DNA modification/repair radical SAM protein [Chloroflexota bacterium]